MCFQIRVVSQDVRFSASQLDELYNLFKVSNELQCCIFIVTMLNCLLE